jgi:hypothetical protein
MGQGFFGLPTSKSSGGKANAARLRRRRWFSCASAWWPAQTAGAEAMGQRLALGEQGVATEGEGAPCEQGHGVVVPKGSVWLDQRTGAERLKRSSCHGVFRTGKGKPPCDRSEPPHTFFSTSRRGRLQQSGPREVSASEVLVGGRQSFRELPRFRPRRFVLGIAMLGTVTSPNEPLLHEPLLHFANRPPQCPLKAELGFVVAGNGAEVLLASSVECLECLERLDRQSLGLSDPLST